MAFAAIITLAFVITACDTGGGGGTSTPGGGSTGGGGSGETTYKYSDDEGNAYKLLITPSEVRAAQAGDTYTLTITFKKDGKVQTSTGKVEKFENNQFNLKSSDNKAFEIRVKDNNIAGIAGDDLPFELPPAKTVTITGFTPWNGKQDNNGGEVYKLFGVFLIADPDDMYNEWFPRVTALWYATVESQSNVNFGLIIPVDNTWNYGRMPWTGKGDFYVLMVPCVSPNFFLDEAKVYKNDNIPVKVSINEQTTTLEFSKFADYF